MRDDVSALQGKGKAGGVERELKDGAGLIVAHALYGCCCQSGNNAEATHAMSIRLPSVAPSLNS